MRIVEGDWKVYRDEDAHIAAGEGPGVDLCDSEGAAWLAPFDWTCVSGTGYDPETGSGFHAGYVTVIRGTWKGDQVELHFCHGQANEVSVGQTGSKGDVIGHVGYSGTCIPPGPAGAHLHFWARIFVDGVGWQRVTRPSDLLAEEEDEVDLAKITEALNKVWDAKTVLEASKPLFRPQRNQLAKSLLDAVVEIKEVVGIE